jgi:phosphoribosylaminoimidazole-succinocarboxamide synthase
MIMTTTKNVLTEINFDQMPLFKTGKVRSVFDFGDQLLIVASDRVSAFDFILPTGIPSKGAVLTSISEAWFARTSQIVKNHLITTDIAEFPEQTKPYHEFLEGRSMLVKKTELIPVECVVRGYLIGSGWKDYQATGQVCGIDLPKGLQQAGKLEEPIFTPAFKAEQGEHDENISFAKMIELIGEDLAEKLKAISLELYSFGRDYAEERGIILADTKFEFGLLNGEIILIDEVLTPDSSRYWPKSEYQEGISPPSYDKQIVRDYLANCGWDKQEPIPSLPEEVITKVVNKYQEVASLLKG